MGTHGTCSTTASNLCATAGCKCGTTTTNVAACSGATPFCLTAALATPAVGVAASCKCKTDATCHAAVNTKILSNRCVSGVCKCGADALCTGTKTCKDAAGTAAAAAGTATAKCA